MSTAQPEVATPSQQPFWIFDLTAPERSTLVATFGGWALDGMDLMVYSFVIPTLIAAWHISKGQAGLLGTAALLISAVGGWLAGLLADRFGRVRILQITILWFALFTFLSGFTNSFWQLLMTRGLQGLGFGGEWAVGSVLMGEAIRAQYRGKAVGTVQGGWAIGWGVTAICYTVLFSILPAATAWRAMFWIGILPALLVFYIRRNVPEPEVFNRTRAREAALGEGSHFLEIFSPAMLKITFLTALLAIGVQGGYYAITTWLPTFLKTTRGLSVLNTGGYLFVVIVGSFVGYMISAWLADRLGRKQHVDTVCSLLVPDGNCVHLSAHQQLSHAGAGIPAWAFLLRDRSVRLAHSLRSFFPAGCAAPGRDSRITSDAPSARCFRPWLAISARASALGHAISSLCCGRLPGDDPCRAPAAGDQRERTAGL